MFSTVVYAAPVFLVTRCEEYWSLCSVVCVAQVCFRSTALVTMALLNRFPVAATLMQNTRNVTTSLEQAQIAVFEIAANPPADEDVVSELIASVQMVCWHKSYKPYQARLLLYH